MDDKIGDFLELEPLKQDIQKAETIVKDSKLDNDFEYARGNLYAVIENGSHALTELLQVAQQSQHPRAFEVVATLVRIAPFNSVSLITFSPVLITAKLLVVGIFK